MASDKMATFAALHNADMIPGGEYAIRDFGDRSVNSRIGAQWNSGANSRLNARFSREKYSRSPSALHNFERETHEVLVSDLDEYFQYFLQQMGPAFDRKYVPPSTIDRYRGKLPDQLLQYWDAYGWCGYADGLFWTVDPGEFQPALEAWIGNTLLMEADAYHVIARGAFGNLYLWGERTGFTLLISTIDYWAVPQSRSRATLEKHAQLFFSMRDRETDDFDGMFAPALAKLGRLMYDEMYGFVPAPALGGAMELKNLQKVKAVEHLVFVAQLADLEVMQMAPR